MPASSRLTAEISVPETVHLPADRRKATLEVDVLCRLHNDGDDDYVVGSESLDDAHHWHVLSESHREVMRIPSGRGRKRRSRKGGDSDVHPFVSQLVAGGHSHNAPHTLTLDARKLTPGKVYTVRYEYHGHVAEARFTTVPGHSAPTRRRKKAPVRKRTRKAPARAKKASTARTKKASTRKKKS